MDMLQPHYGIGMHQAVALILVPDRESCEVLLAILKKRKKVTFLDDTVIETKRPRLDSTVKTEDKEGAKNEVPEVQKVLRAKEIQPNLSQTSTDAL